MRRKYALVAVAGFAVLLAAGIGLWLAAAPGWAVAQVEARASAALGQAVRIGGAHLELSPELAIRLDDVHVAGADPADGDFLTARTLRVPVTVSGLLARRLELNGIRLRDTEVDLEIDAMGRPNWPDPAAPGAARIFLERAAIRFFDQRNGQSLAVADANLAVDFSAAGEVTIEGSAASAGRPARLQGYLKDLRRAAQDGSPAELTFSTAALEASFNGRLSLSGSLGLAGTASVSGPALGDVLRWTGAEIAATAAAKPFTLAGGLDATGRAIALRDADTTYGGVSAKGDLTLDFRAEIPVMRALLTADRVDLAGFLPSAAGIDWSSSLPFELPMRRGIDAAITLNARHLTYGSQELGPGSIAGKIAADGIALQADAGPALSARLAIDTSASVPALDLAFKREGRATETMLTPLFGIGWLAGSGGVALRLAASGRTPQEMVSTLKGEAHAAFGAGAVRGADLAQALKALGAGASEGWPPGATPFTHLAADFTVADGIATATALQLETPAFAMSGTGDIDLLRRAIDLRLNVSAGGATAATQMSARGAWAKPRLAPGFGLAGGN